MINNPDRDDLEKNIIDHLKRVDLSQPNQVWITSHEYQEFLDSWRELVQYHRKHREPVIGLNLVDGYLEQCEILRAIMTNDRLALSSIENARIALGTLEYWLREVLKVVSTYNVEDDEPLDS